MVKNDNKKKYNLRAKKDESKSKKDESKSKKDDSMSKKNSDEDPPMNTDYQETLKDLLPYFKKLKDEFKEHEELSSDEDSNYLEEEEDEEEDETEEEEENDTEEEADEEEEEEEEEDDNEEDEEYDNLDSKKLNIVFTIGDIPYEDDEDDREMGNCYCDKPLQKFNITEKGWWCNNCHENSDEKVKSMNIGSIMYGCRKCDYDICENCYKKENILNVKANDESLIENIIDKCSNSNSELVKDLLNMAKSKKQIIEKNKEKVKKRDTKKNIKQFRQFIKNNELENEIEFFRKLDMNKQKECLNKLKHIHSLISVNKPYRMQLIDSDIPDEYKANAMKKLASLKNMEPGSGEYHKLKNWIELFMQIPFNTVSKLPVSIEISTDREISEFLKGSVDILNNIIYGMEDVKLQVLQLIGQWISNPDSIGTAIAIKGPPGTGKTTLVKDGISKILKRYFALVPLGGNSDGADFIGHGYTYEGAKHGHIIDIIIKAGNMSPCILFDELDKISDTPKGGEVKGILTHLTDTSQNDKFSDKYFSEIEFDLSKALYFFTYNDDKLIDPILKDRLYCIETKGYNKEEKLIIAKNYLITKIREQVKMTVQELQIPDKVIEYIIEKYSVDEKGVRNLKRSLEIIFTKINLYKLMKGNSLFEKDKLLDIKFPLKLTRDIVSKLIPEKPINNVMDSLYM